LRDRAASPRRRDVCDPGGGGVVGFDTLGGDAAWPLDCSPLASARRGGDRGMSQSEHDLVIVIDFGAQYAQLIARRVREAKVYSEIMPHTATVEEIVARKPKAIILS